MRNMMFSTALIDEVMAQPFYTPDEEVSFDPHYKRDALSISHSLQGDTPLALMERSSACIGSGPDIDTKGRNSTRRRIPVACNRCRKRKIKCSGDGGDGQGCSNCRSSGNTNCQFLRVNSAMLQPKVTGWPYPMNATIPHAQRLGVYGPSITPKIGVLPGKSPNLRAASFSRASEYDMGATDAQNPYSRQSFGLDHTINYEDEAPTAYHPHSSTYMLPTSPQAVMPDICALPWNPKGWNLNLHSGRASSEIMFSDHDIESHLTHPAYSYILSGQGSQPTDIPSIVPPSQGGERTLPNPTSRNPVQVNVAALTAPAEAMSGLPAATTDEYKSGNRWLQKSDPRTFTQHTSSSHESLAAGTGTAVNRPKLVPNSAQDMVFGFLPIASAGSSSHLIPAGTKFATLDTPVDSGDELHGNHSSDGRLARTFSRENNAQLLSLAGYSSETYGYSSSEKSCKNRSEAVDASSGILVNGMQYTRPDPHLVPSLPDTYSDFRSSTDMHRTPVTGLSSPGGF